MKPFIHKSRYLKVKEKFLSRSCGISLVDHVLITGGYVLNVQRKVSKYTRDGWEEDLPELNSGRYDHGCGHFKNDENILVRQNTFFFSLKTNKF